MAELRHECAGLPAPLRNQAIHQGANFYWWALQHGRECLENACGEIRGGWWAPTVRRFEREALRPECLCEPFQVGAIEFNAVDSECVYEEVIRVQRDAFSLFAEDDEGKGALGEHVAQNAKAFALQHLLNDVTEERFDRIRWHIGRECAGDFVDLP